MKVVRSNLGLSLISLLMLGTVVAGLGVVGVKSLKNQSDKTRRKITKQRSSLSHLKTKSRLNKNCSSILSKNGKISKQKLKKFIHSSFQEQVEIKIIDVQDSQIEYQIIDKNNLIVASKKINLVVKNQNCRLSFDSNEIKKDACNKSGAQYENGKCGHYIDNSKIEETDFKENKKMVTMSESLCDLEKRIGNKLTGMGVTQTRFCPQNIRFGCKEGDNYYPEGTERSYTQKVRASEVKDIIGTSMKESLVNQKKRVVSEITNVLRVAEHESSLDFRFKKNNYYKDITGVNLTSTKGASAALAGSILLYAGLGPVGLVAGLGSTILASVLKCSSRRKVHFNRSCKQGKWLDNSYRIEKKKFRCKGLSCKCRWRNEKNIAGVKDYELYESILKDNKNASINIENFEDLNNEQDLLAEFTEEVSQLNSFEEFYKEETNNEDQDDQDSSPQALPTEYADIYRAKEEQLWREQIRLVRSISNNAGQESLNALNKISEKLNQYTPKYSSFLKSELEQSIQLKRADVEWQINQSKESKNNS